MKVARSNRVSLKKVNVTLLRSLKMGRREAPSCRDCDYTLSLYWLSYYTLNEEFEMVVVQNP